LKPWLFVPGVVILALLVGKLSPANAQTFTEATNAQFADICASRNERLGSRSTLSQLCSSQQLPTQAPATQHPGSQTQPNSVLISQQQLKKVRTAEEHKEKKVGASPDVVSADVSGGFSTFVAAGGATLRHHENDFEEGYNATIPSVTAGGDYRISDKLVTGLAFNYSNSNGDFDSSFGHFESAGGFNIHSYGPLLYLNYIPFEGAFADVTLGYARQNNSYSRFARANPGFTFSNGTTTLVSGDFTRHLLSASIQTGYDHTLRANDSFTIGPRIGLNVQHWLVDDYQESGNTGLELRYQDLDQTSVQTTLGFKATYAFGTSIGTVLPYFAATWVHEFANGQRTIQATVVQDSIQDPFPFKTEKPARDWAALDAGVSVLMSPKLLAFVTASTVQGNANFTSYGGNVGLRANW
jgi:outer membrane autotransporter protein